jgi:VWFA-related protein
VKTARILLATAILTVGLKTALAQSGVVIRSTTRLVQVQVWVQDEQGRPVAGLRKEDFQVFDERKEQPLVSFAVEGGAAAAASFEAGANGRDPHDVRDPANSHGYSVVLLDWLNGSFFDRLRGDDALHNVLETYAPRQKIAVYALGMEPPNAPHPLRLLFDFTDSPADLAATVRDPGVLPHPQIEEAPGKFDARSGSARRAASAEEQLFDWNNRILDTVHALTDLAGRMARLPGRKSLIWLSAGFPEVVNRNVVMGMTGADANYNPEIEAVLARLNRENVTVYTVNTMGLATTGRSYNETLKHFTGSTGGTSFSDRNDLDLGLRTALDDLYAGYTLGFLAPEGTTPGLHRLQVRIRRPHVKLRFRESYQVGG